MSVFNVFHKCEICDNNSKFTCNRCHQAQYCTKSCQQNHWVKHKPDCIEIEISMKEKQRKNATSSFNRACLDNNLDMVKKAMDLSYFDINSDDCGLGFIDACSHNHKDIVQLILDHKHIPMLHAPHMSVIHAFFKCLETGNLSLVQMFLNYLTSCRICNEKYEHPLGLLAKVSSRIDPFRPIYIEIAKLLLEFDPELIHFKVVALLDDDDIANPEDIDVDDEKADTLVSSPLKIAAQYGNVPFINLFVDAGANPMNGSVLLVAVNHSQEKASKVLMELGSDVNAINNSKQSCLHLLAMEGGEISMNIMRTLLASSRMELRTINSIDTRGRTPLMVGVCSNDIPIARMLINSGAKVDIMSSKDGKDYCMENPLHIACQNNLKEMVHLLLVLGRCDVNCRLSAKTFHRSCISETNRFQITEYETSNTIPLATSLIIACIEGNLDIVKLLIEHGADINIKTASGKSAIMYAKEGKFMRIVNLLKAHEQYKSPSIPQIGSRSASLSP
jgi:ankyrin repeat protein